jgi:signal transduction histidine kinase
VEQHGGIIEVEIQVGVSTTFRIKLPIEVNA